MDIASIVKSLENCPCGRAHDSPLRSIEIGRGLTPSAGEILESRGFSKNILLVADRNTLGAAEALPVWLEKAGFKVRVKLYDEMRTADMREVNEVLGEAGEAGGILSVGTGSLNDICRMAVYTLRQGGRRIGFAIFATAPSMDGFASGSAPITEKGFKTTRPAVQPDVLIADSDILAAAPAVLKSAGFGDMAAKYIALADWRISSLLTGEYYCENIAALTREALRRMEALADRVTQNDPETAAAVMEALVFTGVAMQFAGCVRPASGAEHMISHFWEMKKLEAGQLSDFHGRKVGVATLYLCRLYHALAELENIDTRPDRLDWAELEAVFGPNFIDDVKKLNMPTITDEVDPAALAERWPEVRRIIREEVPEPDAMLALMQKAGAALAPSEIAVTPALARDGYMYHAYLRRRLTLSRLVPMICEADKIRNKVISRCGG